MHERRHRGDPVTASQGIERFSSDIQLLATPLDTLGSQQQKNERTRVSMDNIERSRTIFSEVATCDDQLKQLVGRHIQPRDTSPIDRLRKDHELRCEVLSHFMDTLDDIRQARPDSLPPRVRRDDPNNLKEPNYVGGAYPLSKMTSSEYSALLALSMIDGSFDWKRADNDTVSSYIRTDGTEGGGSHRDAACVILGLSPQDMFHSQLPNYPDLDRRNDAIISQLEQVKDLPSDYMTVLLKGEARYIAVSTAIRSGESVTVFQSLEGDIVVMPTTAKEVLRLHGES